MTLLYPYIRIIAFAVLLFGAMNAEAQCTDYQVTMPDDPAANEISWTLVDQNGVTWLSGGAPYDNIVCLPDGCYTLLMFDSTGNGWDGLDWDIEAVDGNENDHTTLDDGLGQGFDQMELGNANCGNAANCSGGQNPFFIDSNPGGSPGQMSWTLALNGVVISSGGSDTNDTLCLDAACLVLVMNDTGNNGWQGGSMTITDENGAVVYTGTLASGSTQTVNIPLNGGDCNDPGGGGPGGGGPGGGGSQPGTGPGGGCGPAAPGGDCATAGCACDPFTFNITPSGFGNVNEVPTPGSVSNPSFFTGPPWGGTAPFGCLLAGELNSTWLVFTVSASGTLQFSFGAGGGQVGFYDWAMWPFTGASTCTAVASNVQPPVRCVWNATTVGGTGLASPVPPGGAPGNYGPPLAVVAGQQFIICLSNWSFVNASVTLDFFGTAGIQCGPVQLPVELISFRALDHGAVVRTQWITGSELNNDHFDVERSTDGEIWSRIGTVEGVGNSTVPLHYSLDDEDPRGGWSYYRLRQVDHDGSTQVSNTEAVFHEPPTEAAAWPMPNDGNFHVSGFTGTPLVVDALGRSVPVHCTLEPDGRTFCVNMAEAATGVYTLIDPTEAAHGVRVLVDRGR